MAVQEFKPLTVEDLTKVLSEISTKECSNNKYNFYCGSQAYNYIWDIVTPKLITLYGVKFIDGWYEAVIFDDISKYSKFNLVVTDEGAELKPPYCIELQNFEKVSDNLIRFSIEQRFNLEHSTLKLECVETEQTCGGLRL